MQLLLSNSTMPGEPYFRFAAGKIAEAFRDGPREWLFVPFAGVTITLDEYTRRVSEGLAAHGMTARGLHTCADPIKAIAEAEAIAIGGGNTFRLLERLHALALLDPIRERAAAGVPIAGWSAGANVCGPSLKTTNDMPIIEPASFDALGLAPFQINPHYTQRTLDGHGGESRDQRLAEFLVLNPEMPVACLPEGSALHLRADDVTVDGRLKVLRGGEDPAEYESGARLTRELRPAG